MPDRRDDPYRHSSSSKTSSKSPSSSSSKTTSKSSSPSSSSSTKKDDWSEVNEPDERRRIQNRIAQRKFREKTKDAKETRDRNELNQRYAASAYASPDPRDLRPDYELDGLPWGGPSMKHIVARGHESASRGGSLAQGGSYDYAGGRGSGSGSGRGDYR